MASARPKAPAFTTHIGSLRFPKISSIDLGSKDYPNPEGAYSANLIVQLADSDTQALIAKLTPLHERAIQLGQEAYEKLDKATRVKLEKKGGFNFNGLYTEVFGDDEEPTGDIYFGFKMKASGTYKSGKNKDRQWDSRPPVFDKKGTRIIDGFNFRLRDLDESLQDVHVSSKPDIWGGTTARVSFDVGVDRETGEPGYFIPGTGTAGLKLGLLAVQVLDIVSGGARNAEGYGFSVETDADADGTGFPTEENSDF